MHRLILALLFASAPAHADKIRGWQPGATTVTSGDLGSRHLTFKGQEGYLERWVTTVHRDDGGWMQLAFVLTNFGPGDGNCVVDVMRIGPEFNDPKSKHGFDRWPKRYHEGNWTAATDRFSVTAAGNTLSQDGGALKLRVNVWGYEAELTMERRAPGWKPGGGEIVFPGNGRFQLQLFVPVGAVTGRERNRGGEWQDVRGTGWAEHEASNVLPHLLAEKWLRFEGKDGGTAVHFLELFTPPNWDGERFGWLVVTRGGKVVATSLDARATPTKMKTDAKAPHHKVPIEFTVHGTTAEGPVKLTVSTRKLALREDLLAAVPAGLRTVVEMFIQPFNFYQHASFKLELPDGTRAGGKRGWAVFSPVRVAR